MVFLLGLVVFLVSTVVLIWGLISTLVALISRKPDRRTRVLRKLVRPVAALGVACYAFGIFAVGAAQGESTHGTDSSPSPACRQAAATPDTASHLVGYEAGYLPPRFTCRLDDGTTYSADVVSPWLTPIALALGATALALTVIAAGTPTRERVLTS
jgi:hypothetical protein